MVNFNFSFDLPMGAQYLLLLELLATRKSDYHTNMGTPNGQINPTAPNILASLPLPWLLLVCGAYALK
jgi:hypothetical protein